MIRRRELSSRELLELFLARIEKQNPRLNAVVTLDAAGGREAAARADAALDRGESFGPLHGLPITIKDSLDAAKRLRGAGAVILGKTNLPVFAGEVQSYDPVFGTTNNP